MTSGFLAGGIYQELVRITGEGHVRRELLESKEPGQTKKRGVEVYPVSAAAVAAVVKLAYREAVPVVVRGAGAPPDAGFQTAGRSDMPSGTRPAETVIILSLERLNRIRYIDVPNLFLLAEPGVALSEIRRQVREAGCYFPDEPGRDRDCLLGICVRCDASGCLSEHIHGVEVVLAGGEFAVIGGEGTRDLDEYQLAYLLSKGEQLAATVTGIYLKLRPRTKIS